MSEVQRFIYSVKEFDPHTNKWRSPSRYSASSNYRKRIWAERYVERMVTKGKRMRIVEYQVVPTGHIEDFPKDQN